MRPSTSFNFGGKTCKFATAPVHGVRWFRRLGELILARTVEDNTSVLCCRIHISRLGEWERMIRPLGFPYGYVRFY